MVLLVQILSGFLITQLSMEQLVSEYHAVNSQESEIKFIEKYQDSEDPSVKAYVTSLRMKQAEYAINPLTKLRIFRENKEELEALINESASNVHLRYVRLVTQENTPEILGYNQHLEEDRSFLKELMKKTDDSDFMDQYIRKYTSL